MYIKFNFFNKHLNQNNYCQCVIPWLLPKNLEENYMRVFRKLPQPSVSPSEIMHKLPISGEKIKYNSKNHGIIRSCLTSTTFDKSRDVTFEQSLQRLPGGLVPDEEPLESGACERLQGEAKNMLENEISSKHVLKKQKKNENLHHSVFRFPTDYLTINLPQNMM